MTRGTTSGSIGLLLTLPLLAAGQAPPPPSLAERLGFSPTAIVLIVNGDDVGVSHAANQASIASLERGLMTNDYFQFPKDQAVSPEQRAAFKAYLRKRAQGVSNAHNPLIMENGAEWKQVSVSAKDAQLLELRSERTFLVSTHDPARVEPFATTRLALA